MCKGGCVVAGFGSGMAWMLLMQGRFLDTAIMLVMTTAMSLIANGRLPGTAPR